MNERSSRTRRLRVPRVRIQSTRMFILESRRRGITPKCRTHRTKVITIIALAWPTVDRQVKLSRTLVTTRRRITAALTASPATSKNRITEHIRVSRALIRVKVLPSRLRHLDRTLISTPLTNRSRYSSRSRMRSIRTRAIFELNSIRDKIQ